jgi:hypothetical protein
MFGHNSGTPGAISTKVGIHVTVCMYKNRMYILFSAGRMVWEASMGSTPPPAVTNRCRGNVYV